jgi:hypothetical protein
MANKAARHDRDELDEAFDELERATPHFLTRSIRRVRKPQARVVRLLLGIVCILAAFFWFLPALGIWMLPLGLLLIAQDVPFMRRPVGRMTLYLLERWARVHSWWKKRQAGRSRGDPAARPAAARTPDRLRSRNGGRKSRTADRS